MAEARRSTRRTFLRRLTIGGSLTGLAAAWGGWSGAHAVEVTRRRICVKDLPPALEGFRIVQMSDFHHSAVVSAEYLAHCVELANAEEPDLIALTGDFITGPAVQRSGTKLVGMADAQIARYLDCCIEVLSPLRARHGVCAVLGNHDGWFSFDHVVAAIGRTPWRLLRDEQAPVRVEGATLQVVGLRDLYCEEIDLRSAFRVNEPSSPTLVLMHNPDAFLEVARHRPALILAGHTHGGQVSLPFIGPPIVPSKFGAKYAAGLFRSGASQMYVNRGLGVLLPPIRFRVPPEISVFDLTRETPVA